MWGNRVYSCVPAGCRAQSRVLWGWREGGEQGLCIIFLCKAGTPWGGGQFRAASSQASVMELCSKEICVCLVRVFNVLVFIQALCVWRWPQVLASPCGVCSCPPARIDIFPPPWWSECSWSSAAGEAQDFSRKSKCPKLFDNNYLKCSVKALNLPSQWLSSGPCNKKCIFLRTYSLGNRLWYCICN